MPRHYRKTFFGLGTLVLAGAFTASAVPAFASSFPVTGARIVAHFDFSAGQLIVPHPPTSRKEIQESFVREHEIDPNLYYPKGYHPELLQEWPVSGDLVVPISQLPPKMLDSMGDAWRKQQENQAVLKKEKETAK